MRSRTQFEWIYVCMRHKTTKITGKYSDSDLIYLIKKQFDCNLTYRLRYSTHVSSPLPHIHSPAHSSLVLSVEESQMG